MTVQLPPDEPFQPPRRQRPPEPQRSNLAMIAAIAFVFGVFLHGCVALSILDSGGGGGGGSGTTTSPLPSAEPEVTVGAAATQQPSPLPDRTTCAEIRGTEYRSAAERQFFLANCLATATPTPSATATATATPAP